VSRVNSWLGCFKLLLNTFWRQKTLKTR
jgi:hypothetical protein